MVPQLSVFIACSLDGFIATRDHDLGWLESAGSANEDYGFEDFVASVDLVAMGRGTYDFIANIEEWPYQGRPVQVFTHRAARPHDGVTFWSATPREAMARWTELRLRRVYVDGGRLISAFLAEGLIDDLVITIVPRLLGDGIRLFDPWPEGASLKLLTEKAFPSGMVTLTYARDASPNAP